MKAIRSICGRSFDCAQDDELNRYPFLCGDSYRLAIQYFIKGGQGLATEVIFDWKTV